MMQLLDLYKELSKPSTESGAATFQVVPIPGYPRHRIGRDCMGSPALLLRVGNEDGRVPGPVALQHITVQHRVRCSLLANAGRSEDEFTVIRCVSGDRVLREYFIGIAEATVQQLGQSPSRGQVTRAMQHLTELFRAFELSARKTAQGLWAELVLVAYAADPIAVVTAWHADPNEAFDFADGKFRVEVKSVARSTRTHSFSLRQVRPGPSVDAIVASIRAERSTGGVSISDLLATIRTRGLDAEALFKVQGIVAHTLGDTAVTALSLAFDLQRARSSLRFFDTASIPSVDPNLPLGVENVRFEATLDDALAAAPATLAARATLFAAALPS